MAATPMHRVVFVAQGRVTEGCEARTPWRDLPSVREYDNLYEAIRIADTYHHFMKTGEGEPASKPGMLEMREFTIAAHREFGTGFQTRIVKRTITDEVADPPQHTDHGAKSK